MPTVWTPELAANCVKLLEALVLDTGERWGDGALQPWQRDAFAATLGLPGAPDEHRALRWLEGPTGCGKDQIIAAACLAALRFAPDGYEVVCYSADFDRCGDVKKTVRAFVARTDERGERIGVGRWLGEGIEVVRDEIRSIAVDASGARVARVTIRVEALDGYSASGARADPHGRGGAQRVQRPGDLRLPGRGPRPGGRAHLDVAAPPAARGRDRRDRARPADHEQARARGPRGPALGAGARALRRHAPGHPLDPAGEPTHVRRRTGAAVDQGPPRTLAVPAP